MSDECNVCWGDGWVVDMEDVNWCGDPDHCSPGSVVCPKCGDTGKIPYRLDADPVEEQAIAARAK